jgi:hypothetical protein
MSNAPTETFFATVFATAPEHTRLRLMTPRTWSQPVAVPAKDAVSAAQVALELGPDAYVGCALYDQLPNTTGSRGRATDVVALTAIWADLDVARPTSPKRYLPDRVAARRFLASLAIRPTVQVWSGGGYHPWWVLREALVIETDADRARAERLVRRWQQHLRLRLGGFALDSTFDLSRVLRVPGMLNSKYATFVELEDVAGPYVDPAELEELCIAVPDVEVPASSVTSGFAGPFDPAVVPPAGKFAALCRSSRLFARLWRREITPKDSSQSGFDFAIAKVAAWASWSDADIVSLLIAHRRLGGGPLKLRPDYFSRTIARARIASAAMAVRRVRAVKVST